MLLQRAFVQILRYPMLILCPIILDLIAYLLGGALVGFIGTSSLSYRLILEMGLPSVSHLINIPLLPNQLQFMNIPGVPTIGWAAVVLMLLLMTFAQGGYIGILWQASIGEPASIRGFIREGKVYWIRFIFLYLMIMFAKTAVTTLLVMLFQGIGLFLSLLVFIVLRILFIYLEFTIVVDRSQLDAALRRSRQYFKQSRLKTMVLVFCLFVVSGLLSTLIHQLWSPYAILAGIVIGAYVVSVIQLALMMVLSQVRAQLESE
ncbi:hypothetical protein [Paenibacillus terrigena]|uniref:hypothetical protein n=1 Tax=Paenibacillus terrigena TaxID=369333 RepID=UPI000370AD91|nr:hypothetical protein [Paenibacillus terrigena]